MIQNQQDFPLRSYRIIRNQIIFRYPNTFVWQKKFHIKNLVVYFQISTIFPYIFLTVGASLYEIEDRWDTAPVYRHLDVWRGYF